MKHLKQFSLLVLLVLISISTIGQTVTKFATIDLNMRSEGCFNSPIVTIIPKGTPITIKKNCNCKWIEVEYNGFTGYVNAKYISKHKLNSHIKLSNNHYYTNSRGRSVHSPAYSSGGVPAGATAICNDGMYSFSQSRRGTCSHHGGVNRWLR